MKPRLLAVIGILVMLFGLFPAAVMASPQLDQVVVPIPGPALNVTIAPVNDGAGGQTDPHLSGDWVVYSDHTVSYIRFQNLDLGVASDRLIPHTDGEFDELSDISGNSIVFLHYSGGSQGIYLAQIDPFGNPGPAVEVSPSVDGLRRRSAIGGDTIAFEVHSRSSTNLPEIWLSSVVDPTGPAYRLTNDSLMDLRPAISPDGSAVVWVKCSAATICDVWRAERTAGIWGAPEQVTDDTGNESLPDTNGPVTVYESNAGGNENIRWSMKDSSGAYVESVLDLPGAQRNPNIIGNFISFESNSGPNMQFDIYLYDLATNRLYQLTDTAVSETLSDVTINAFGVVRVAWAQPKQVYPYDMDVYALDVIVDTTSPVITPEIQGTRGANGWYNSDVTLIWAVSDAQSDFTSTNCDQVIITSDQASTDYTCSATSAGGTASLIVSIARDATAPVVICPVPGSGELVVTAGVDAAISGLDEAVSVLSGTIGGAPQTLTFTAVDLAGNTATKECFFNAGYNFTGFFQPVDNPGEGPSYVFNSVKAGSAVPVKFSLSGDQGLDILADGSPVSRPVSCATAALSDPIEQTVLAGNSSLSYEATSDTYTYVWKTEKGWTGNCRVLIVGLDDGTQHLAYFQFK